MNQPEEIESGESDSRQQNESETVYVVLSTEPDDGGAGESRPPVAEAVDGDAAVAASPLIELDICELQTEAGTVSVLPSIVLDCAFRKLSVKAGVQQWKQRRTIKSRLVRRGRYSLTAQAGALRNVCVIAGICELVCVTQLTERTITIKRKQ